MTLLERLEKSQNRTFQSVTVEKDGLKRKVHEMVIGELGKSETAAWGSNEGELEHQIREIAEKVLKEESGLSQAAQEQLIREIINGAVGYGPIQELLHDEKVSEIMVNGIDQVFVECSGRLEKTEVKFENSEQLTSLIERIVAPLGRRIDESMPMVDARLKDGSRVNAIIPPLSLKGPILTIRKFSKKPLEINNLVELGTLSEEMATLVEACVKARLNIIISGGTGSGKTTTLNVLSSFIPGNERIVTIEDAAELQLMQEHVVPLETRPSNIEGRGEVTIRELVRNALRMRPDRIVVGEVRSGEALDMLQAMNTGHDGSLTTGHANSPRDLLSRLETMVLMAGMDLPVRAIREQIASAIDVIIQQSRMSDGKRRITYITEVLGMEGDIIVLQDIFRYNQEGFQGGFRPTGIRPKFISRMAAENIELPQNLFFNMTR
ncbi:CpaF family protein [Metallumcola ferriviriculae]|uniref:CpaF family protein n=1 Tax=Metallumcola ferriviriculae TaxID=3039180 RepID=A0AAU0UTR6_9FIRM|nr:CpaF family protein [Desulfitibacteraceae bacterium MK1]